MSHRKWRRGLREVTWRRKGCMLPRGAVAGGGGESSDSASPETQPGDIQLEF